MFNTLKLKNEISKLLIYACSGAFSTAIDCCIYYLLLNYSNIDFRLIQPISMTVGLGFGFLFGRRFVFKNKKSSFSRELIKYIFICCLSISVSPIIMSVYHIWFGEYIIKIPVTVTMGLINYFLNRYFVYNDIEHKFIMNIINKFRKEG